jgi:hypothetical protein
MRVSDGLSSVLQVHLIALARANTLGENEILCDLEEASLDDHTGVVVITDLRVLHARTRLFGFHLKKVWSVLLDDVQGVDSDVDPLRENRWGMVTLYVRSSERSTLEFCAVPGGRERAEELERVIRRQRQLLKRN